MLKPIEGSNLDLTAEWYFRDDGVGQLTLALFHKRLNNVLTNSVERIPFTNNGATFDAIVTTPGNAEDTGKVKGFEFAYQQVYDLLPGWLSGFGLGATYTYVDFSGVSQVHCPRPIPMSRPVTRQMSTLASCRCRACRRHGQHHAIR